MLYAEKRVEPEEDYEHIRSLVTPELKPLLHEVRAALLDVHRQFGIGYSDTTCKSLIAIRLKHAGLRCESDVIVIPQFHDRPLPHSPISPLVVERQVLVEIEAIQDDITSRATRTMQTHLQMTGAAVGFVVNFGKDRFQIRGVRPRKARTNQVEHE